MGIFPFTPHTIELEKRAANSVDLKSPDNNIHGRITKISIEIDNNLTLIWLKKKKLNKKSSESSELITYKNLYVYVTCY